MDDLGSKIQLLAIFAPVFIFSLSAHEFAHAWSAFRLGDDTAARLGRLTLNPKVHIDLLGTIIIPVLGVFFRWPLIGWANPVPINPLRFGRKVSMGAGMALTAAAGPIMNLILALAFTLLLMVMEILCHLAQGSVNCTGSWVGQFLLKFFYFGVQINVFLAIFNLIPLPPLDGSRILRYFLPYRYRDTFDQLQQYSMFILIGLLALGVLRYVLVPPVEAINWLLDAVRVNLGNLILSVFA